MIRLVRLLLTAPLVAALPAVLAAQDPTQGVRVVGVYDARATPGIVVLPVSRAPFADSIQTILQRDLEYSNRFTVIRLGAGDASTYRNANGTLNYALFNRLGAKLVVNVVATSTGLQLFVHDVAKAGILANGSPAFPIAAQPLTRDWRLAVHTISDRIHELVFGTPGIAATRIAYSLNSRIKIVDSDGHSAIALPAEGTYAYNPAWSPSGDRIVYTTFPEAPRVYIADVATGQSRVLVEARRNATMSTPVFSPDGGQVVFAISTEGPTDLWTVPASGGSPSRLTTTRGNFGNQSPSFSPDGRRIAFMTDRLGRGEVYIMDADGTNAEIIRDWPDFNTDNFRGEPDWSPDGRTIAFSGRVNGVLQIMTLSLRDGVSKVWTSGPENHQPSWAPDGRHIVFTSKRTGRNQLHILDTETAKIRQLTHEEGSKMPAWSPRLSPKF